MSPSRGRFTPSSYLIMCDTRHMNEPPIPLPPPKTPCHNFVPQQALPQLVEQYLLLLWVMLFLPEPRPQKAFEFNHNYGSTYLL